MPAMHLEIFRVSRRVLGVVSRCLLIVFTAAVSISLAGGRAPSCRCFGQLKSSPVGAETLIRNGILAVTGAAVAFWPGDRAVELAALTRIDAVHPLVVIGLLTLALLLVAVEGWALLKMMVQQAQLLKARMCGEVLLAKGVAQPTAPRLEDQHGVFGGQR